VLECPDATQQPSVVQRQIRDDSHAVEDPEYQVVDRQYALILRRYKATPLPDHAMNHSSGGITAGFCVPFIHNVILSKRKPKPFAISSLVILPLNVGVVSDRRNVLWLLLLGANRPGTARHDWLALKVDVDVLGLGGDTLRGVRLDSVQELVSAAGFADVLDADVDALLDVSVADLSEDDNTDGALGDVVHNTGLSVVDLVWHTVGNRVRSSGSFSSSSGPWT